MTKTIVRRTTSNTSAALSTLHPILQRIYLSRGLTESHELERDLKSLLPFHQLSGIDAAAQLLVSAIQTQKRILIIGDYDADGATSTVLAIRALRVFGAKYVDYVVPNRFEYGYGLSPEIVKFAAKKNPELIITVDNGISSIEGVELANQMGISVLITDHHLAGRQLPQAAAIVNPNQAHDLFPSKHLAGVGVIFYVMLALRAALREQQWFTTQQIAEPNMAEFLDVVALGTVADVVVLDKNNRILVHQGLKRIRAGQCSVGLRALTEIGKLQIAQLTTRDLGFVLGPRLNAAGRLEDMSLGIECLLCQDETRARQLAKKLDDLNHERRDIEEGMKQQAFKFLKDIHLGKNFPYGLCLFQESWHQGVIGILASRVKDKIHRPVIAFALENDHTLKGSARSIPGLHIRDVLDYVATQNPGLIKKFGGHAMAAGLSLAREQFQEFSEKFNEAVKQYINPEDLEEKLWSDGELTQQDFDISLVELIEEAGPWGQGFPAPAFDGEFAVIEQRIVGEKHLKLTLKKEGRLVDAIAFFVDTNIWPQTRCDKVRLVYKLDINEYLGNRKLQLIVEHIEPLFVRETMDQCSI